MSRLKSPQTLTEQLMYCTVRLLSTTGSGTGYFCNLKVEDLMYPLLITNKHVVNHNPNEQMTFQLHLTDDNGGPGDNITIQMKAQWYFHPTHDLCCTLVKPLMDYIENTVGRKPFYIAVPDEIIASKDVLDSMAPLEELVMVGYPIGLWDEAHNLPIFRRGYAATHPGIDFVNFETDVSSPGVGVVDMACFNGSSGSPVFVLNENGYSDNQGNVYLGSKRILLIGTLYAGPEFSEAGRIEVVTMPTSQAIIPITPAKTNLGYYIKSTQLDAFRDIIKNTL